MSQIQKKLAKLSPNGMSETQIIYLVSKIKRTSKNNNRKIKVVVKGSTIIVDDRFQLWVSMESKLAVGTFDSARMWHFNNPGMTISRMYEMMAN